MATSEATTHKVDSTDESSTSLIILSQTGHRIVLTCTPKQDIASIKTSLLQVWPTDFGPSPAASSQIRLIHGGKFLLDTQTLDSVAITQDNLVIHVNVRPESSDERMSTKIEKKSGCCVIS